MLVGVLSTLLGGAPPLRAAAWIGVVAAADVALSVLDRRFRDADPNDDDLPYWAWARTVALGLRALSWGLCLPLIQQPDDLGSLIIPAWGLINLMAASAYTAGPFFPCLLATTLGGIVPAVAWLALQNSDASRLAAMLLVLAIPFIAFIGRMGWRNVGALIEARLDLASALEQQSRQMAIVEDAMSERTRFFSAASHDLRQPLQALGFYASLLMTSTDDAARRDVIGKLSECAANLDRQFAAILGVAEAEAASRRAAVAPTGLQGIFERVAVSIRPEAALKGLSLRIVPTRRWAAVAPELLERVLVNLLANAVRYTRRGGVLIGVRPRGSNLEIWVVDTGIGISAEHRARIFDEFYQIENPARSRERGFGLGLAIVRRLCGSMHWALHCRSKVGRGSIFSVAVPAAAALLPADVVAESPSEAPGVAARAVMLIDDDPSVRDAMSRVIAGWGVKVVDHASSAVALEHLAASAEGTSWLVLIDYRLDERENGLDVARKIRATWKKTVDVVLMTAETNADIFEEAGECGIPVLRKPIKPIRLRALVTAPALGAGGG
ncbi:response regulator [Bradyrhizobium sp. INPA01-394B]|uniref:histidine kinase n=1 Tax=Bradyrhizobium campsiandrae TaxID=1729892 RepID=A0ABR7UFL9_9BRAD|nr:hybrid sensor histidine kinase/response regulator [Bradyrhizobium campsiandrae]MBC9878343.1 response regulator [Bradyrhizobium campsiandrae]MBC9982425.1 response regulator [Bradyrhizobium campsiandrae]